MSQRVTLDHPSMDGRVRHSTSPVPQPHRRRKVPVDSMLVSRAKRARQPSAPAPVKPSSEVPLQIEKVQQHATTVSRRSTESVHAFRARRPQQVEPEIQAQTEASEPQFAPPAEEYERAIAEPLEKSAPKQSFWQSWKSHSIYGMATLLFIVGMGVAISGFMTNNKAKEQIEVLGAVIESGDEAAIRALASSLPSEDEVSDYDISDYKVAAEQPRYIRIPTIGVGTTRVLNVGLTSENAVDVPKGIYDTSWYNGSAKITDKTGAMFVVGHYVGPTQAGIFSRLKDLNPGDEMEIEQGDGTISKFRVVEKIDYDTSNVDMTKSLNPVNPNKLGLNLMTCGGGWDADSQTYDERTLIRTEKI